MAVRIPIITVFDSKGLRAAEFQLRKVSQNFSNLGRNFTIAGAAFGAVTAGLGKSVKVASDLGESINAVNVSFGRSAQGILDFGKTASTTLGLSAVDFNNAAVRFSAFADRIVGSGGDASGFIQEITTRAADFASVFNIDVAEALRVFQSGLAGEAEPLKRFGVNLLDSEVKAYAAANGIGQLGKELTETEKVQARYGLLLQATNKTAGDFANTSGSLANGMRILKAQITDTQAEVGQALLPALQEVLPVLRELITEFGTKLTSAVRSVDWRSTITSVINLLTFFVQHIEVITRLVAVLWTLNTAYNAIKVTVGLANAALTLFNFALGNTQTAATKTTGVINGLKTALLLGGVTLAVGSVIDQYRKLKDQIEKSKIPVSDFNAEVIAISGAVGKLDPVIGLWQNITKAILGAVGAQRNFNNESSKPNIGGYIDAGERRNNLDRSFAQSVMGNFTNTNTSTSASGGSASARETFGQIVGRNVTAQVRQNKLVAKGLSEGAAQLALSTVNNKKQFKKLEATLSKPGVITKRQGQFNRTAAGIAELESIRQANEARNQQILADQQEAERQRQAIIDAEQAAADERERIYQSFANSVTNIFASIKDAIVGAFSLPELGGSTDSIIRNMDKLLSRLRTFSTNITQLSSMGLNPTLLQQVIQAGPVAGARLAASLVSGGADALSRINAGFGEIQTLGSEIGMTGTQARFGTSQQQQIINVNINGGLDSSAAIGKAVVDAVRAYERTSGAVWQGA